MEVRGVWITNVDSRVLYSRANIAQAMAYIAGYGFNVVFPVVWNKGVTLFPSKVMAQNFGIEIDPLHRGRDPLQEVITEAKKFNLKVIPWFEYGFASSYQANGGNILAKKPHWAGRDYYGKLLTKNGFEWMNALDPEVQNFMTNLILEVVRKYDVDGIQGDDRLPAMPTEGGYDDKTVNLYRQQFGVYPPANRKDSHWLKWRADILTNFLANLYKQVKAIRPKALVSLSPSVYRWGLDEYLQDYVTWLDRGLVDLLHPQLYRRDLASYQSLVYRVVTQQLRSNELAIFSPGILAQLSGYRISTADLINAIEYNRSLGVNGEVLFFYEAIRANNDELGKALRNGPYRYAARP